MNEVHLSTRLSIQGAGGVRRDIGSKAGDGFKALFHNLINSAPAGPSDTSSLDQAQGAQDLAFEETSSSESSDFDARIDEIYEEEGSDTAAYPEGEIAIDDFADALENGSTSLTEDQVTSLIEEVKSLLKDPKTASKVLAILEKAGVDVQNLNDVELRKALESLPLPARRELAKVLRTENPGLNEATVPQVLSEALSQMRQEFRQKVDGEDRSARDCGVEGESDGSMADAFLEASGAEVTAAEEAPSTLDTLGKKAGEVLEDLVNLVVSEEAAESAGSEAMMTADAGMDVSMPTPVMMASIGMPHAPAAVAGTMEGETPAMAALGRAERAMKGAMAESTAPRTTMVSDMEKSKMLQRLMAQARLHLTNGEGRFQIRMEPAHLGQMRVTIENHGGVVSATILTESESARQALQQQIGDLKAALADQGVQVGKFGVLSDPRAFGGSGSQGDAWQDQMERHQRKASSRMVASAARRSEARDMNSDGSKETA
ncbi:MAG: flagellar hook-length control protein FliK [Planctomycetota bacterium]